MKTQKKFDKDIKIKFSMFFKITALIFVLYIVALAVYLGLAYNGKIELLKSKTSSMYNDQSPILAGWGIFMCNAVAITYSIISLYLLFTHRGNEDSRWYCLPIIITPFFLLSENAILHLFDEKDDNFYTVTMTIYTTMALGVATFASLKYSFKISGRREISTAISQINPKIKIVFNGSDYILQFSEMDYYLSGLYSGKVYKIFYRDSKRTGTAFKIKDLFFPNNQEHFVSDEVNLQNAILPKTFKNNLNDYDYAIFTSKSQCYYFVALHSSNSLPIVISANLMAWLVHKKINWYVKEGTKSYSFLRWIKSKLKIIRNFIIVKLFHKKEVFLYYEAMDCFNNPDNVNI